MQRWVALNEEHQLLICLECETAVRSGKKIESHFRHAHKVKSDELREILSYFEHCELRDPMMPTLPADGSLPIPKLRI